MLTLSSTPIASAYYLVKVGGDVAVLKGMMKALLALDAKSLAEGGAGVLDREFIDDHTTGIDDAGGRHRRDLLGRDRGGLGADASGDRDDRQRLREGGAGHHQLRHGDHPASPWHRQRAADRQSAACCAGTSASKGAGICPLRGHRTCRATAPSASPRFRPRSCWTDRPGVRHSNRRASKGHNAVEAVGAMRDGRSQALIWLGGNFAVAMSDPEVTVHGDEEARPRGAYRHQAQSLASAHREAILHSALPGAHRDRRAGTGPPIGHGRGFDVDGPRLARRTEAGVGASQLGTRDHRRAWRWRRCRTRGSNGPTWSPTTQGSAMRSRRYFRILRTSMPASSGRADFGCMLRRRARVADSRPGRPIYRLSRCR